MFQLYQVYWIKDWIDISINIFIYIHVYIRYVRYMYFRKSTKKWQSNVWMGFFFQIGKLVFQNSRCIMILYLHVIFYDFLPIICILQYYYMIDASVVFHTIGLLSVVLFDFMICIFFTNLDFFLSCIKIKFYSNIWFLFSREHVLCLWSICSKWRKTWLYIYIGYKIKCYPE